MPIASLINKVKKLPEKKFDKAKEIVKSKINPSKISVGIYKPKTPLLEKMPSKKGVKAIMNKLPLRPGTKIQNLLLKKNK